MTPLQNCTVPVTVDGEHITLTGNKALDILRGIFHFPDFRGCQREAVESISNGQNTVLIMPTGGGKTICYAVPALMKPKVTVIIFPLLALLLDQVERIRSKGLNVCFFMSDMEETEKENAMQKLQSNPPEYNFLFVTPETLLTPAIFDLLQKLSSEKLINFFVIDEAHCIDTWGFHFRPSYSELWKLQTFGCPILAMMGTATQCTEQVILNSLRLSPEETKIIRQPSNRPNLLFHVVEKKADGKEAIVSLIKKEFPEQCGIIYCVERKDTVDIAYSLKMAGVNAVFYHAGIDVKSKQATVESWKSGAAHVICATVAFGMGIDKPDVSFVIHHSMPKDLESYVQESGRAGRDGSDAHCYIFFRFEDRTKHLRNISLLPDGDRKLVSLNGLNDMVKYCIIPVCRRQQIAYYFGDGGAGVNCDKSCDICSGGNLEHLVDFSDDGIEILNCLDSMRQIQAKVTTKLLTLTFRGSKSNAITSKGFQNVNEYGKGRNKFSEKGLLKFIQCLIIENIVHEQLPSANENRTTPYLVKGTNASRLTNRELTFLYYTK